MSVKEHWNAIFEEGKSFNIVSEAELDALLGRAGMPKTALDIACGAGDVVVKLAKRGLTVTGADISPVALSKAEAALRAAKLQATLVEADFDTPDFAKNLTRTYDVIFMRLAIAFVADRDAFLEIVKKLMTPDATFVCITPGLLPDVEYNNHQKSISLSKDEIEQTLARHFSFVESVTEVLIKPDWPRLTYACRQS